MTNQIFDIRVFYYDIEDNREENHHLIYNHVEAVRYGKKIGACSNVISVDVVDTMTGEVILTMENGDCIWV